MNFEALLTGATLLAGLIYLLDILLWVRSRPEGQQPSFFIHHARSFFPVLLFVLLLRSFVVEPFRIPSGSEKPELLVGDFIIANKFIYGLRLPVVHIKFMSFNEPKHGDVAVFLWPHDPSTYFIKRVIGLPGDQITYHHKILSINGHNMPQSFRSYAQDEDESQLDSWPVVMNQENLLGIKHDIYINPQQSADDFSIVVPPGEYFVMGDNRDNSYDSRYWGFVPERNLVGKAFRIFFSWNHDTAWHVRWHRLGKAIH